MNETENLVHHIVEGIQEKKGRKITIVDLTGLDAICDYFVICEGNSNTQISAITDSVEAFVRKNAGGRPFAIDGLNNALWVVLDYGEVMVHVFERETRAFYHLENLWFDAKLTDLPDLE